MVYYFDKLLLEYIRTYVGLDFVPLVLRRNHIIKCKFILILRLRERGTEHANSIILIFIDILVSRRRLWWRWLWLIEPGTIQPINFHKTTILLITHFSHHSGPASSTAIVMPPNNYYRTIISIIYRKINTSISHEE